MHGWMSRLTPERSRRVTGKTTRGKGWAGIGGYGGAEG